MKIAANLSMLFTELPLLERIAAAAAEGFSGVEVQFPYDLSANVFAEELVRLKLPLVLMNLPAGDLMLGGPGLAGVPSREAEFEAALLQALDYAMVARPLCVNVLSGRCARGVPRETAMEVLAQNLRKAAEAFQVLDIRVVFEAINPVDMPGFLINTPEHLREMLQRVAHPNCFAQLDFYHMARQGIDIYKSIELLAGRIGHVQFADNPGRGEPGTGTIDFSPLFHALFASGYQGWLGAEFKANPASCRDFGWLQWFNRS